MSNGTIWLAHRYSHLYGGAFEDGQSEDRKQLLAADTDPLVLTRRLNAYFEQPEVVRFERGNKIVIPAFATRSNTVHGSGGGCSYTAYVEITQAPRLKGID